MSFVLIDVCQPGGAAINFSKMAQNQNQTTFLLLKNLLLLLTSASEICLGCTVLKLWIFLFSKLLWFETISNLNSVSNRNNFESKKIHSLKTVHPKQILIAEVRGNERFFKVKVLSDFEFGHFWENWSQRHLETKLLWTKFCLGDNHFMSIVWKMSLNSHEELFYSFFLLKWGVIYDPWLWVCVSYRSSLSLL